jgi:hypothetical protein
MGVILATTFGLMVWIVLWALGIKAFDGFMITLFIGLLALVGRIFVLPLLPSHRDR